MNYATESPKSYKEKCHFVFPFTGKTSQWVREESYLEFFKENIEAVEIPIEVVRNGIISTIGTTIFFSHGGVLDGELFEEFDFVFMKKSDITDTITDHCETCESESKGKT